MLIGGIKWTGKVIFWLFFSETPRNSIQNITYFKKKKMLKQVKTEQRKDCDQWCHFKILVYPEINYDHKTKQPQNAASLLEHSIYERLCPISIYIRLCDSAYPLLPEQSRKKWQNLPGQSPLI